MSSDPVRVWAVIATFRRPGRLAALLASLGRQRPALAGAIVVENAGDAETAQVLEQSPLPVLRLRPEHNLGCGGGVALALRTGVDEGKATHFWQLDDDAEMSDESLGQMLAAMRATGAGAVVPLIVNDGNRVCWFPGPLPRANWRRIGREVVTPATFRERFGDEPLDWTWSPWTSLLVTRAAVERAGVPRGDYWFQGEDIEFTLRLSAHGRCVLAPAAVCVHHADIHERDRTRAFLKKCALLQNNAYTFTHLAHGARARRHLPGNFWRFLREERACPAAWSAAARAFWLGAGRGLPAGAPGGDAFRRAWERLG